MKLDLRIKNWYPLEFDQPIRRFTVAEYHQMLDVGILSEDDRVELIEGIITQMNPKKTQHSVVTGQITEKFYRLVPEGEALLRVQEPIILSNDTEPEPDLAVVRVREDSYLEAHPSPDDVLLLIEVSDTTLETDTLMKLPRYAASGIPEVWIANLVDDSVEVYREPTELADGTPIYQKRTNFSKGDVLSPEAIPSLKIAVANVLI